MERGREGEERGRWRGGAGRGGGCWEACRRARRHVSHAFLQEHSLSSPPLLRVPHLLCTRHCCPHPTPCQHACPSPPPLLCIRHCPMFPCSNVVNTPSPPFPHPLRQALSHAALQQPAYPPPFTHSHPPSPSSPSFPPSSAAGTLPRLPLTSLSPLPPPRLHCTRHCPTPPYDIPRSPLFPPLLCTRYCHTPPPANISPPPACPAPPPPPILCTRHCPMPPYLSTRCNNCTAMSS